MVTTETRNPNTTDIDRLPVLAVLERINDEDATVAGAVRAVLPAIAQAVERISDQCGQGGRLLYFGAGTSGRLAMLDAVECVPTFGTAPEQVQAQIAGGDKALTQAVEGAEDDAAAGVRDFLTLNPASNDIVVGVAASGRTPYVIAAVGTARERGIPTVGVACNVPSPLLDAVEIAIGVVVGPEVVTGSTRMKAGTAQKLVLNMLSTAAMIRLGKTYGNLMVDVRVTNQKLAERAARIVQEVTGVSAEDASRLLTLTNREVKPAIVMALLGGSVDEARERLAAAQGRLADVIGTR